MNACQNCDWRGPDEEMDVIQRLGARVEPGEAMPSGQCPKCGALCQPADDYSEAIRALQGRSEHGVKDAELIDGARVICRTLNERFSRDGEYRGGSDAADAIDRMCDAFDEFETAIGKELAQ